jgi:hypothetical protein
LEILFAIDCLYTKQSHGLSYLVSLPFFHAIYNITPVHIIAHNINVLTTIPKIFILATCFIGCYR